MPQGYFDENYMYLGGGLMRYSEESDLFIRHGMDPDSTRSEKRFINKVLVTFRKDCAITHRLD